MQAAHMAQEPARPLPAILESSNQVWLPRHTKNNLIGPTPNETRVPMASTRMACSSKAVRKFNTDLAILLLLSSDKVAISIDFVLLVTLVRRFYHVSLLGQASRTTKDETQNELTRGLSPFPELLYLLYESHVHLR